MLKINVMPRGCGKTTIIKNLEHLHDKEDFIILILSEWMKGSSYKDFRYKDRIFTMDRYLAGEVEEAYKYIYIDDALTGSSKYIAEVYFKLGKLVPDNVDIIAFGTPREFDLPVHVDGNEYFAHTMQSKVFENAPSWFKEYIKENTLIKGEKLLNGSKSND